jgi:hypothetical protein
MRATAHVSPMARHGQEQKRQLSADFHLLVSQFFIDFRCIRARVKPVQKRFGRFMLVQNFVAYLDKTSL